MTKTFQERLKSAREDAGLTQKELAKMIGVRQQAIGNMERGTGRSGSRHVGALAKALGVNALWLETGKGPRLSSGANNSLLGENAVADDRQTQLDGVIPDTLVGAARERLGKLIVHFGNLSEAGQEALIGEAYKLYLMERERTAPPPPEKGGPLNLTKELQPNGTKASDHHQGEGQRRRKKSR